jgi:hypothetical protein
VEEREQEYLRLRAMVDVASRTVLRVNQELQSPAPDLREFITNKRQEGWDLAGITPCGVQLLIVLKRPLV